MAIIKNLLTIFLLQGILVNLSSAQTPPNICATNPNALGCKDVYCPEWYPPISNEVFSCPSGEPDGVHENPRDCCTFYKCVSGHFYCYECPGVLVFDPVTKDCLYNYEVPRCRNVNYCADVTLNPSNRSSTLPATTPTTPTTTTTTPTTTTTTPTTTTTTPTTTTTTPTTTTTTPTTTTTTPTTTTTRTKRTVTREGGGYFECPDATPNGKFPITGDTCSPQFYFCIDGDAYLENCPTGSVFDPVKLICVEPQNATCSFTCPPANGGSGFYPIPGRCVPEFYICVSFTVYDTKCPGNNIFDPVLGYCLSPTNPELSCRPSKFFFDFPSED